MAFVLVLVWFDSQKHRFPRKVNAKYWAAVFVGFGLPSLCATIFPFLCTDKHKLASHASTRCASHARPVGRIVPHGNAIRHLAGLRRPGFRGNVDGICLLLSRDAAFRRARGAGCARGALRHRRRHRVGRRRVPCIPDLWAGDKYFWDLACRSGGDFCVCAAVAGGFCRTQTGGRMAGFLATGGSMGGGEILSFALGVAVSERAARVRFHRGAGIECGACRVRADAARGRNRLLDWVGAALGTLRSRQLSCVWMHRDSARDGNALHCVRATVACVVFSAVHFAGDFLFYGVAGRVSFSGVAAKYAGEVLQERSGGVVGGFGAVWIFTHYESWISELEVRDSGVDRGDFLWLDVEEDGVDLRVGDGARARGRDMALLVPDGMKKTNKREHEECRRSELVDPIQGLR